MKEERTESLSAGSCVLPQRKNEKPALCEVLNGNVLKLLLVDHNTASIAAVILKLPFNKISHYLCYDTLQILVLSNTYSNYIHGVPNPLISFSSELLAVLSVNVGTHSISLDLK